MKTIKAAAAQVSEAELASAVRETLARLGKPTTSAELRRALPKPHQRPAAELARLLAGMAEAGSVHALTQGKTTRYSDRDPVALLTDTILAVLREGPLEKKQLAARIKREAPALEKALAVALGKGIERGAIFEHPRVGKVAARYAIDPPDVAPFLAKAVAEMESLAKKLAPSGVTPAILYRALGRALGLEAAVAVGTASDVDAVRAALRELASREPPGALLSVRALRARVSLDKARFDDAVLRLARAGGATIHHHDFPASLSAEERAALVVDEKDVHYVGIAPREPRAS